MNIPFTALYFASYETAKRGIMKHANSEESLLIQGVAGELALELIGDCAVVCAECECLPASRTLGLVAFSVGICPYAHS